MSIRRLTRLTNAFSKKIEHHRAAIALHFALPDSSELACDTGHGSGYCGSRLDDKGPTGMEVFETKLRWIDSVVVLRYKLSMPVNVAPQAQEQLEFEQTSHLREDLVGKALRNPSWDFRTVGGIAKETGLTEQDVEKVLSGHKDLFRRSVVPDRLGRAIYTIRDKPISLKERIAFIRMLITKSIS
jgi:hypothetical protein